MELAEQRPVVAFNPPYLASRARRPQNQEHRQGGQFAETGQQNKAGHFLQNMPPASGVPEQQKISQYNQFSDIHTSLKVTPAPQQAPDTAHQPKSGLLISRNRQSGQSLSQRSMPQTGISRSRQQPQQVVTSQAQPQPQFRPESQTFPQNKEMGNGSRSYNHIRFFPTSERERQLPAETGSFVNNRGYQLNDINKTTDRLRITKKRVQQASHKPYVELDRSRTTTDYPLSEQATDRGITGASDTQSSLVLTTEGNLSDDDDDDGAFQEPPSEEQFKDEDLFYLHDASRESDVTGDFTSTESSVKDKNSESSVFRDEFNSESGEIDFTEEVGFSKSPSYIQTKDKDIYGNSEMQDYIEPTESISLPDIQKSTTNISSAEYAYDFSSPVVSSSFSTEKPHQFHTPATLPPISTKEPLERNVSVTKSTSEPHATVSYINVEGIATHPLSKSIKSDDISTSAPVSPSASATVSPTTEDPVRMKLKPIFVEIIHRGSSEPPFLKTYTVQELERRRSTTKSPLFAEKDNFSSRNPESTASTSQMMGSGEMSTTQTLSPSPVTLTRRVRPPKKLASLTPVPDITPAEFTASFPSTVSYVTLSRKVQPPVLILTSSDQHDKDKRKGDDTPPVSSTSGTGDMSSFTDHTTPISPVTLSRIVQPPLAGLVEFSSGLSTSTRTAVRQEIITRTANQNASVSFQTIKNYKHQNISKHQLPKEAEFEHNKLVSTESSASHVRSNSESTKNFVDEIQHQTTSEPSPITTPRKRFFSLKRRTMTDTTESTTPSLNASMRKVILTRVPTSVSDIPVSIAFKQEQTSPQYRNRDGLTIPASSGPSTLHSLAVYFAAKDSNQETTVNTLTDLYSRKRKGKGEKTTTESVPASLSIREYSSSAEVNETHTPMLAPNFLTKSTRDSYSMLFPNTSDEQNSSTEEPARSTARTALKSSAKIKPKDRKITHSSHDILSSELLEKLAEISEMEEKPPSEKRVSSSERGMLHSETEDLLEGTDSRDLRELAHIFSRALSAYLEDPEEFKRVLTKVRPQDPSSVYVNDVKQAESNHFLSTTVSSVISSTTVPLTSSSTQDFSVTKEDEEVLDFSDVSKVSRKKSKSTGLTPPYSKSFETRKWKDVVSTSYENSAAVASRKTGISETVSNPSSIEAVEERDLKPPEEGLQNAQSTYYILSNGRVPLNTASVSQEVFEHAETGKGSGTDYSLPPGTKQYQGPAYGPQPDEVKFAPTAGGVNDPSRPRYGGFQNNSGIPAKETSINSTDIQSIVKATTFVPEVRYQTRSTVHPVSTTANFQKPLGRDVVDEFGNILNTFVPQEVNNLAIFVSTETPGASLADENVQSDRVQTYNSSSREALHGVNTTGFTPLPVSQSSNTLSVEQKWNSLGSIVDALTINYKLSESDIEERNLSTVTQEFSSPVATTRKPTSTTKPVHKTRQRFTTESFNPEPSDPTTSPHDIPDTSSKPAQTQRYVHSRLELEADSANSDKGSNYNSNPQEEMQPLDISGITFYSEKIKPLPPASASLIQVSVSKTYKVEPLTNSSTSKYMSGKISEFDNSSEEMSVTTSANIPLRKESIHKTQAYPRAMELESSTLSLRESGTKKHSLHSEQSSRSTEEPDITQQDLTKNAALREAPEMLLPHRQPTRKLFTDAAFSETLPTAEITTVSWKQETKQFDQEIPSVNLQPVQSSVGVPFSVAIPSSQGVTDSGGTKNSKEELPYFYKEGVEPLTSTSTLDSANSSSVIVSSNSNISSRGTKFSEKHKSLNNKVTLTESNDASNSQQSVRISTMVSSTESPFSSNSPTIPTSVKIYFSNRSQMSVPRASVEADLRMDNVTTDQLQALEDIQTMIFPCNSTMSKDGTMFNNLNQSSTLSLIDTMKQAVTNSTVRRLVLLLVNSLKGNTPEETQSRLIAALLRVPVDRKLSEAERVSVSMLLQKRMESLAEKSSGEHTLVAASQHESYPSAFLKKSSQIPMTEQPDFGKKHLTTTQASATNLRARGRKAPQILTPQEHTAKVAVQSNGRRPVRLRMTTESSWTISSETSSPEKNSGSEDLAKVDSLPPSDTRAVELLRSLYSLASRWG
ncbi:hypothetical protein L798_12766 [Zootermopsis nevadensis]|uniref:Uncharacterized protein n=2 Tax=Zootermopsis nevadensis TaxID=136037 RepID=A0A067RS59_ZOONE|nr:hypothetical protein L798_12766 [Zootermopsis nevadensis]